MNFSDEDEDILDPMDVFAANKEDDCGKRGDIVVFGDELENENMII